MHESANIWEQGQLLLLVRDKRLLEGVDPFSVGLSGSERGKATSIAPPTFEDQLSAAS